MKVREIMKKILLILMIFVFLTTNYSYAAFYYSGTQKGTYNATQSIWSKLINSLADIADYIIGLATWGQRMFLVGWTSIAELALNDTLEAAAGDSPSFELNAATLDMTDANDQRKVTVENIVFNKIPILDINFFDMTVDEAVTGTGAVKDQLIGKNENGKVETSGTNKVTATGVDINRGAPLEETEPEDPDDPTATEDNVIVIIKKTLANWYYGMRTFAIACMLIVLLYIALRLIVATVGEQKAKYKEMLYNWLVGFAVVFCIHYIMLFVILINEELVSTFEQMSQKYVEQEYKTADDKTNTEMELSLYTSLRSRAYEVKATRGWIGTILYMVLVYYAVRFTLVYLKRYFTVMILAMMAPVLSATYAFGKVRTGKAESFNKWLKEFIFAVLLQSVHAMTYVTLITQILKLTETSVIGAILAFMILNFMLKTDAIVKRIFNMSTGQHSALDNIISTPGNIAQSLMGLNAGMQVAGLYGKYWLKPVYGGMAKVAGIGLSLPKNAILGAAGGALEYRNAHKKIGEPATPNGGFNPNSNVQYDADGKPMGRNSNNPATNANRGAAHRGYDPIYGAFDPNKHARKAAEKYSELNKKRLKKGKEPYKWGERTAMFKDSLKGQALGKINRAIYNSGYFEQIKITSEIDARIEAKMAKMRENAQKLQKQQIQKMLTAMGGIAATTLSIPLIIASPKMGLTLLAKGYSMSNSVAKYDRKGKIAQRSLGLRKVDVEKKKRDENGKVVKETVKRYRVTGLMTSMGTFVKKGTGIAYLEGLTTNIGDDVDKVVKQNKKDMKELEMLFEAKNKLLDLEVLKQEELMKQDFYRTNSQNAKRIKDLRERYENSILTNKDGKISGGLDNGAYSVYAGRVMKTNEEMKKFFERKDVQEFMDKNGISKAEAMVAMNSMMALALEDGHGDISKVKIDEQLTYHRVMENVSDNMTLMQMNFISANVAEQMKNGGMKPDQIKALGLDFLDKETKEKLQGNGLTDGEISVIQDNVAAQRKDNIDYAMVGLMDIMKQDPETAKKLVKAIAIQEATAEALNQKEEKLTEMLSENGLMRTVEQQDEMRKASKEIAEDKEKIADLKIEKGSLEAQKQALQAEKDKLDKLSDEEKAKKSKEIRENQEALESKIKELDKIESYINGMESKVSKMEQELDAKRSELDKMIESLGTDRKDFVSELNKAKETMTAYENEKAAIENVKKQLENEKKQLDKLSAEEKKARADEIKENEKQISEKLEQIKNIDEAMQTLDKEMKIKENEFEAKQREIDRKIEDKVIEVYASEGLMELQDDYKVRKENVRYAEDQVRKIEIDIKNAFEIEQQKLTEQKDKKAELEEQTRIEAEKQEAYDKKQAEIKELEENKAGKNKIKHKTDELTELRNELYRARNAKKEAEKRVEELEIEIMEQQEILENAETRMKDAEMELSSQKQLLADVEYDERLISRAVEDVQAVSRGAKTRVELDDAKKVTKEEVLKSLEENGGYESLLELERVEKPNECQKKETRYIDIIETGGVAEVEVTVEDLDARKEDISKLIDSIKDKSSDTYREKENKESSKTWEEIKRNVNDTKDDWYEQVEKLANERTEAVDTDVIEDIKEKMQKTIDDTKSKTKVEELLKARDVAGAENDTTKMTEDDFRKIYRDMNTEDYVEQSKKEATDIADIKELDRLKAKIKEKLKTNISDKDKSKLNAYLDKMSTGITVEDYNKMVIDYNGMNAMAEEAFIKEMLDDNSASNKKHNDDFVTTSADKIRRGLNSQTVRNAKGQTEIQSKVAEILRSNDYAQFEVVTSKSSSYAGKKAEKGPIINISNIIKNL